MIDLPAGTVTFLFTDIEGSTQLWERYPQTMRDALSRHDDLLREAIETHNGRVVKTLGDGVYAVFRRAADAVAAAIDVQRTLRVASDELRVRTDAKNEIRDITAEAGPQAASHASRLEGTPSELVTRNSSLVTSDQPAIRVRIGIHTGEAELREGDYHGTAVNRAGRLMSAGHGGQILLSATTAAVCEGTLPPQAVLRDLGEHRLRGLARPERIYQLVMPGLLSGFPPLRSLGEYIVSLPTPATGFVRRDAEVKELVDLLADPATRLLSLVGPGGVGKTRLAIQAAGVIGREGDGRFLHGVYFVPLASLVTADSMVTAVAQALGFRFRPSEEPPRVQLLDFLRRKRVLLVMDNFEHLLAAGGAELPADILAAAPDVAILATSRTRLNIPGEYRRTVTGMRSPDAYTVRRWLAINDSDDAETIIGRAAGDYSAMCLFAQCAARVRPGFRLGSDNVADVARICRQVQGLPLGIELAAAWLEALSLPEIAEEIEHSLDILTTEQRGVPERQRSIRAVFDTSWALLTDRERAVLPMLSVFRGTFARDAAEFVTAATPRDLLGLVNKSWLQPSEIRDTKYEIRDKTAAGSGSSVSRISNLVSPATGRFILHALLRQYAEEKLSQLADLEEKARDRQARYFARFLESNMRRMLGEEQAPAFDAVAEEFDDIHSAWEWWARRGEFGRLVDQMLMPLYLYATARFVGIDVAPLLEKALELIKTEMGDGETTAGGDPARQVQYAALLIARAAIYMNYFTQEFSPGDVDAAWDIVQSLGDDGPRRLGFWYAIINLIYGLHAGRDSARANLRAFLHDPGEQDEMTVAYTRQALARLLIREFAPEADLLEARRLLDEALAVFERRGNHDARAAACADLADINMLSGRYDEALAWLDRAQPAAESIGNWGMVWSVLLARREVYLQQGRPERMFPVFDEMLAMSRRVGNYRLECWTLGWDSIYALRYHSPERALFKRQGAMMLAEEFGIAFDRAWSALEIGDIYRVMGDADAARQWYDTALPLFQKLGLPMGEAFYRRGLGDLALARGDWDEAYEHHGAYLEWAAERDTWSRNYAHCGMGRAAAGLGRADEALAHYRAALRLALDSGRHDTVALPVACLAHLAAAGDRETAARLASAVVGSPLTWIETREWVRPLAGIESDAAEDILALGARLLAAGDEDATGRRAGET